MDVKIIQKNHIDKYKWTYSAICTISSFKYMKNKHDVYKGKDCMKKFCESLREHAIKIINFIKKKKEIINKQTARIIW